MDEDTLEKIQKYEVKVVPTTVFIDKDGKTVVKKEGSMQEETLCKHLDELLK